MRSAIAILLFLLDLAAFIWIARRSRRRPFPFDGAIGLGLLVGWQAIASVLLSTFSTLGGTSVAMAGVVPPAVVVVLAARSRGGVRGAVRRGWRSLGWALRGYGWPLALVLPLGVILAAVAGAYAPSTWDSMTYHLARVAHWSQNGSVLPYDTNVYRQVLYPPGAEYLLLGLQAVSGTDRLANGLQFVAWLLLVGSAAPLARLAGAPRKVAAWAGPVVAGTPMFVLQATSTQNDLVASATAVALVVTCLPFLSRKGRPRTSDLMLLATIGAAAFLVKATAIVCTVPILVLALPGVLRSLHRWSALESGKAFGASVALVLAIAGPHFLVMASADPRAATLTAPYVFPLLGEWNARMGNLQKGFERHLPATLDIGPDLAGHPRAFPRFNEDLAANPLQALVAAAGLALAAFGHRRVPRRARWAAGTVFTGWVLFQVTFRANPWVSRLETPLFALLPATMGGWAALRAPGIRNALLGGAAVLSVALGIRVAFLNPSRPAARVLAPRTSADDYYVNRTNQRPAHDAALDAAGRTGCRRIGLFIGEDSYDYPLTWRAMKRGIEVRHVMGPDPWACVLVSDRGVPPEGTVESGGPWRPVLRLSRIGEAATIIGGVWIRP